MWLLLMSLVQFVSVDQMFCVEIALARILHGYCRTYACRMYSAFVALLWEISNLNTLPSVATRLAVLACKR